MKRGFSLLELAIVVAISGLMLGFVLKASQTTDSGSCYTLTRQQLVTIKSAIDGFVRKNDRYPLPAARTIGVTDPNYGRELAGGNGTSDGVTFGALPFATLGLPTAFAGDCWGNKFTYAVTTALTTNAQNGGFLDRNVLGAIQIVTGYGGPIGTTPLINNTTTAFAVISHGKDALGAVALNYSNASPGWCIDASPTLRSYNCVATSNKIASSFYNDGKDAGNSYFDDLVLTSDKAGILSSGNLYCWGVDAAGYGILADGNTTPWHQYLTPNPSQSSVIFTKFHERTDGSAGSNASGPCALTADGTAYCWGADPLIAGGVSVPKKIETPLKFDKIFSGSGVRWCGLTSDGTAYCWGNGWDGLNNIMSGPPTSVPAAIVTSEKFVSIALNYDSVCGLTRTDKVLCWGSRHLGQGLREFNPDVTEVNGNHFFSRLVVQGGTYCAITTAADAAGAGKVFCWGDNNTAFAGAANRIGIITNITQSSPIVITTSSPHGFVNGDGVIITHVQGMTQINGQFGIVENATANSFELWPDRYHVEASDSTAYGAYTSGGNIEPSLIGSPAMIAGGRTFSQLIDIGSALDVAGKLYSWGYNNGYQLVDGGVYGDATNGRTTINAIAMTNTNPVEVTTDVPHGLVTDDYVHYEFWNWGSVPETAPQLNGQWWITYRVVVTGPTSFQLQDLTHVPIDGTGFIPYTNADGGGHFFPISPSCSDTYGNHCSATPVAAANPQTFTAVARSDYSGVGLTATIPYGWGSGGYCNVGDGTCDGTTSLKPLAMPLSATFDRVFGWQGGQLLFAMTPLGDLYGWGFPDNGTLGNGSIAYVQAPTLVSGGFKWLDVTLVSSDPYVGSSACAIRDVSCDLPWGAKLQHGDSITAYQSASAPCTSQVRTCTMGVLSGSFTHQTCP